MIGVDVHCCHVHPAPCVMMVSDKQRIVSRFDAHSASNVNVTNLCYWPRAGVGVFSRDRVTEKSHMRGAGIPQSMEVCVTVSPLMSSIHSSLTPRSRVPHCCDYHIVALGPLMSSIHSSLTPRSRVPHCCDYHIVALGRKSIDNDDGWMLEYHAHTASALRPKKAPDPDYKSTRILGFDD
ncbi:hypothetical protein J6590_018605 [Homalodisca vitripennis]|nr:hypothetical protein J6590_018605 [Homalodisca vitripennis]